MSDNAISTLITPNASKLQLDLESVFAERLNALGAPNRYVTYPERCQENVLPWLGWERHVDVWDDNWTEDSKRDLTKNSFLLHKQKGTLDGLKEALRIFQLDEVKIEEWFEYEGDPYLFRIFITIFNPGFDLSKADDIIALILIVKNARSHLEDLVFILKTESSVPVVSIGCMMGEVTTIFPLIDNIRFSLSTTTRTPVIAASNLSGENSTIYPKGELIS